AHAPLPGRGAHVLDHHIDTAPPGRLHRLGEEVRGLAIDHQVCTELRYARYVVWSAGDGEHATSHELRHLDRGDRRSTGRTEHEHVLARSYACPVNYRAPGGLMGDGE